MAESRSGLPRRRRAQDLAGAPEPAEGYRYEDFYAYLPTHGYLHTPTREIWPVASINAKLPRREHLKPSTWLDQHRPVMQLVWVPGEAELVRERVMIVSGWQPHAGACVYNLYAPPRVPPGQARRAQPWLDHLARLYPDHVEQLADWFAHAVQHPGVKINHALMLGGAPGIGKDTLLEPVRAAVGAHNFADINPRIMQGRFNGWVRNVIVRVSEVRDLGDLDRYAFYEHCKPLLAAPPDVVRVDEKNLREYYVVNVCGVIFTTNHLTDGLYLPADDRRHFVAWSEATAADFGDAYWQALWAWYEDGGLGHVAAWLRARDLARFDPKAPPPRTPAFWAMVTAGEAPERGEMRDLIELLGDPPALTVDDLVSGAMRYNMRSVESELTDRSRRRTIPHHMERAGYSLVRNPDADDGLFKVAGRRVAVYAQHHLSFPNQLRAARERVRTGSLP
ncbi:primase-helicase family protein [Paraburkholderia adhaesiva]|uniref:primase-helicase family protein n=1 Tax=Paraburkholderia adhaesiva TaxID=2883244 RepID=UPI001F345C3C|nr:primase-helicase family protein [Paraburkholderia adhaesiva]